MSRHSLNLFQSACTTEMDAKKPARGGLEVDVKNPARGGAVIYFLFRGFLLGFTIAASMVWAVICGDL